MSLTKVFAAAFVLLLAFGCLAYGQDDPLKAREIFVKSRMTTDGSEVEPKPEAKRKSGTTVKPARNKRPKRPSVLGLGYNFYLNTAIDNPDGKYIHVDPSRIFKSGDQMRLVVESTIDGYLYIFNQTNDGKPEMLFPNPDAYDGDNRIKAHQQYLVPGRAVIEFDGDTGTETLTIIVSRTRIAGVPVKQELRDNPKFEITARKFETLTAPATVAESKVIAQEGPVTATELGSRELKIVATSSSTPPPDSVVVLVTDNQSRLSTRIKLQHK
jgi:hypothetical protein